MAWAWAWATASNGERGEWVRRHASIKHPFGPGKDISGEALCELFDLTDDELAQVLAGSDYPERS